MPKAAASDNDMLMYVLFAVIALFVGYIAYTAFNGQQKCEGGICPAPVAAAPAAETKADAPAEIVAANA